MQSTLARSHEASQPSAPPRARLAAALRAVWVPLVLSALVVVSTGLAAALGDSTMDAVVLAATINLVFVVGLYVFTGLSGVFSFGHAAFLAIGAYAMALFTMAPDMKARILVDPPHWAVDLSLPLIPAILASGALAALLALVVSFPIMRISGLTASLATFALLIIVNVVVSNWESVTNGTSALGPVPQGVTQRLAVACAVVAIGVAYAFQRSRFGVRLRSSREDEIAAAAIGVRIARERTLAFVLSAFIAGVAGALTAGMLGSFTPDIAYLNVTFLAIAMLVVGGMTTLTGAVLGVLLVSAVAELLRRVETGMDVGPVHVSAPSGLRELGIAVTILLVLALRPKGVTGGREVPWPRRRAAVAPGPDNASQNKI